MGVCVRNYAPPPSGREERILADVLSGEGGYEKGKEKKKEKYNRKKERGKLRDKWCGGVNECIGLSR
jgi:hypothetical protein